MDKLPDFCYKFSVENHKEVKEELLRLVDLTVMENKIDYNDKGYLYDFPIKDESKKLYKDLFWKAIDPYMREVAGYHGLKPTMLKNVWFQQYFYDTDFGWHQHDAHWAVVYYLELPEPKYQTEFLLFDNFNAKEGDVIFFPTFLVHRAPVVKSDLRKTILATNVKFNVDRESIYAKGLSHYRRD